MTRFSFVNCFQVCYFVLIFFDLRVPVFQPCRRTLHTATSFPLQHPAALAPLAAAAPPPPPALRLTKEEARKIRRRRKLEKQQEITDKIRLGLMPVRSCTFFLFLAVTH